MDELTPDQFERFWLEVAHTSLIMSHVELSKRVAVAADIALNDLGARRLKLDSAGACLKAIRGVLTGRLKITPVQAEATTAPEEPPASPRGAEIA